MIAFPLVQRPEGAPAFAPPCPDLYGALRRVEYHGSAAAALAAHDAWEASALARRRGGPLDRPGRRAEARAVLVALAASGANQKEFKA